MWYKTIEEILEWLEDKSNMPFILLDTETTGLGGAKNDQITQISAIVYDYNFMETVFNKIDQFDDKIRLTSDTKNKYNNIGDKTKWVLGFNRYGSGNYKYKEEESVINEFFDFVSKYEPCLLVAQNAQFDMNMLGGRYNNVIKNEVFDTKMLIQLYYIPLLQKLAETDPVYQGVIDKIGISSRDNGLISSSLSRIGPALEIDMTGYHDALTDCLLMKDMLIGIINLLKSNKHLDISKYQIQRIKSIREN